jgi:5'-AMP-activated protein kinase catalytic alpha subunit
LYRALAAGGVSWKKLGPYNLKCRVELPPLAAPDAVVGMDDGSAASAASPRVLKFEAQLYRLREERYVLDLQRLEGELMAFMDAAGALLGSLRLGAS